MIANGSEKVVMLKGTHGTHKNNLPKIYQNGFLGGKGRRGEGVYFWCAQEDAEEAAKVAWCFVKTTKRTITNKNISVLCCDINVAKDNYLDMEQQDIREMADAYLTKSLKALDKSGMKDAKSESDRLVNSFVNHFQTISGLEVHVLHTITDTPTEYLKELGRRELTRFLNLDKKSCYVVKDSNCILKDSIKEIKVA